MSRSLRVLAVDDEPHALADLADLLSEQPQIAAVDTAESAQDGLRMISEHPYEAVFLDVRMPGLDGIELGRVMSQFANAPLLVFVTAYGEAAVRAFDLAAVDYVLKPISPARLTEAVKRVSAQLARERTGPPGPTDEPGSGDDVIAVTGRDAGMTLFLQRDAVHYLESYGNYVRVVARQGRFLYRGTLGDIEERWRGHGFLRVHRRFVVNLQRVAGLRIEDGCAFVVLPGSGEVPIARRHLATVRRRLQR